MSEQFARAVYEYMVSKMPEEIERQRQLYSKICVDPEASLFEDGCR